MGNRQDDKQDEGQEWIRLSSHIHTSYSFDSVSSPKRIVEHASAKGFKAVAVTDHNTTKGAEEARNLIADKHGIEIIVGAEYETDIGDVIGMPLSRAIPWTSKYEWHKLFQDIHCQGGLAVLPHPTKLRLTSEMVDEVAEASDVIEVFNGRVGLKDNLRALELAVRHGKPIIGGSDAHFVRHMTRVQNLFRLGKSPGPWRDILLNAPRIILFREYSYRQIDLMLSLSQLIKHTKQRRYSRFVRELEHICKVAISQNIRLFRGHTETIGVFWEPVSGASEIVRGGEEHVLAQLRKISQGNCP